MVDIQALFDAMSDVARTERGHYHLTLGALIAALENAPPDLPVEFDRGGSPGDPMSYRGYYSDLAFDPNDEPIKASAFLEVCRRALGSTFEGYKGGDYTMGPDTPLWAASYGRSSCLAIMGAAVVGDKLVLATKEMAMFHLTTPGKCL